MFFKGSRYEKVDTNSITTASGQVIVYKKIRFVPLTQGIAGYSVRQGDWLDQIANISFRDPQHFWRICDANEAMWPDDLLLIGLTLEIPPSEG